MNQAFSLKGKKALVTGGSGGFGAEIAVKIAQAGASVAISGRNLEGLKKTKESVEKAGGTCHLIVSDLATVDGAIQTACQALQHFGAVDILINNAGIFPNTDLLIESTSEDWDRVMAVNLRAPFLIAKTLVPKMIEKKYGKIVNVTSDAALIGQPGHGAYSASKGGLGMLTQVMAAEWGPHNVMSNAVAPTVILTQMGKKVWGSRPKEAEEKKGKIALRRFGLPEEVAYLVLFLSSPASDFLCGATIPIDGGITAIR